MDKNKFNTELLTQLNRDSALNWQYIESDQQFFTDDLGFILTVNYKHIDSDKIVVQSTILSKYLDSLRTKCTSRIHEESKNNSSSHIYYLFYLSLESTLKKYNKLMRNVFSHK